MNLGSLGAVTLTDILVGLSDIVFITYWLITKKTFKFPSQISYPFVLFLLWSLAGTILAANFFSVGQIAVALSFVVRFTAYFFMTIICYNTINKKSTLSWINAILTVGFLFTIAGFFQFLIFPDLTFLVNFGWDPHKSRLVSTLLDPNFSGGLITIFFSLAISIFVFNKKLIYASAAAVFFIAIILTFSRSSYLAFLTATLVIGLAKSPKALLISMLFFVFATFSITQVRDRIVGALTFDETAAARVKSWGTALQIFAKNPVFGVGFNTYRFAQAKYVDYNPINSQDDHSGAGSDSSILLVAATTGIFGIILYLGFLLSLFRIFLKNSRINYLNLAATASFSALLVHSQFVNSLFFPQIMLVLFILAGLSLKQK